MITTNYMNTTKVEKIFSVAQTCAITIVKKVLNSYKPVLPLIFNVGDVVEILKNQDFDSYFTSLYYQNPFIQLELDSNESLLKELITNEIKTIIDLGLSLADLKFSFHCDFYILDSILHMKVFHGKLSELNWSVISYDN